VIVCTCPDGGWAAAGKSSKEGGGIANAAAAAAAAAGRSSLWSIMVRINRRRCAGGGVPGEELALRLPRARVGAAASSTPTRARLSLVVGGSPGGRGRLAGVISLACPGVGPPPPPPSLLVVVLTAVAVGGGPALEAGGGSSGGGGWAFGVAIVVCKGSDWV